MAPKNFTQAEQQVLATGVTPEELAKTETLFDSEPTIGKDGKVTSPFDSPPLSAEHRQRDEEILAEVTARGPGGADNLHARLAALIGGCDCDL